MHVAGPRFDGPDDSRQGTTDGVTAPVTVRIEPPIDPAMPRLLELAREAERVGVDSVWVAEYWASHAFTPLAAMNAQGVQLLSDGRMILGIGASGPQVMEGWHGVPFDRPVQRTARPSRSSR
jgi:alkanesulfonate monooxygenase SsuD/methylene tetrahydromethanopterin reductase-like flavin-dependent oxidoreductase (luciferase family)